MHLSASSNLKRVRSISALQYHPFKFWSSIQSDLPLKEELRKVLGPIPHQREKMVWGQYKIAKEKGLPIWEGDESFTPAKDSLYKELVHWKRDSFWERKFDKIQ